MNKADLAKLERLIGEAREFEKLFDTLIEAQRRIEQKLDANTKRIEQLAREFDHLFGSATGDRDTPTYRN
jgi:hypothetical protein